MPKTKRNRSKSQPNRPNVSASPRIPTQRPIAPPPTSNPSEDNSSSSSSSQSRTTPDRSQPASPKNPATTSSGLRSRARSLTQDDRPSQGNLATNPSNPPAPTQKPHYSPALREELGNAVFFRLSNLSTSIADLDNKPGMQEFLNATLVTNAAEKDIDQFLTDITDTAAMDFPSDHLLYLYNRHATLTQNPGLQTFLIREIQNGIAPTTLNLFFTEIEKTAAAAFSVESLTYLYHHQKQWQAQPGLKSFLIDTLAAKGDETALDAFLKDIQDPLTTQFSVQEFTYLYKHRTELSTKPALKEFLIATLAAQPDETGLDSFLQEIQDPPATTFSAQQLGDLYLHRDRLKKPALKEFLISTLAKQGEGNELTPFMTRIQSTPALDFSVPQLNYLYELRADLSRKAIAQAPSGLSNSSTTNLQFLETTVLGLAIDRLAQKPTVGLVKAALETLRTFGYNERLYEFAKQQATALGKQALKKDLDVLDDQVNQAIAAFEAQLRQDKDPGPEPPAASGTRKKEITKAANAKKAWETKKAEFTQFVKSQLPGLLGTERQKQKLVLEPQRTTLIDQEATGVYAAPELAKLQQFVANHSFHDDVEWALKVARGNLAQAQILFTACQDQTVMKEFGQWAMSSRQFNDSQLQQILSLAAPLNLNLQKTILVAPYLLECSEPATKTWLANHATTATLADLTTHLDLLRQHKPNTQALLIQAIDLGMTPTELTPLWENS